LVLSALANLTAQWLPNWNRGLERIQRSGLIGIALQRIGADLRRRIRFSQRGERRPIFDGSELSVTFVRSALGPNAGTGLDVVRVGIETTEQRASSRPFPHAVSAVPLGSSLAEQLIREPVLLLRSPFRCLSYAGQDRVWKGSWHEADGSRRPSS